MSDDGRDDKSRPIRGRIGLRCLFPQRSQCRGQHRLVHLGIVGCVGLSIALSQEVGLETPLGQLGLSAGTQACCFSQVGETWALAVIEVAGTQQRLSRLSRREIARQSPAMTPDR